MDNLKDKRYADFLVDIKDRIREAQYSALKAVNTELVCLYGDIGKKIVEQQEKFGWGKAIVETLAKDLQKEYPGIKGFSVQNLWYMRQFYLAYKDDSKLQLLVGEISWVKNVLIMSKCKDILERVFYVRMAKKFGWTKDVLIHQIENKSYEKYLLNQTNFDSVLPVKYKHQAKLAIKDEYAFDFLELGDEHSEKELESALMKKVRSFLAEMGGYFCYIGNQYRIEVHDKEYFIDLLLYHRKLKCLIAIELKIGEFIPEFAGKMQFYLSLLDDTLKLEDENPSIGIIICKGKDRTIVEYALRDMRKPMGVSTFKLITKLPKNLSRYFPSKEKIVEKLQALAGEREAC